MKYIVAFDGMSLDEKYFKDWLLVEAETIDEAKEKFQKHADQFPFQIVLEAIALVCESRKITSDL